jgi:glycosyltransferase involved in cell wall biosynthesis
MNEPKIVFFCEDMFSNPYLKLLSNSLRALGVQVKEKFCKTIFWQIAFEEDKPDVIHLQTIHFFFLGKNFFHRFLKFFLFIAQILLLKLSGIKIVWTVHEWADKFENGKRNLLPLQSAILGKVMDGIIVHCESTREDIYKSLFIKNNYKVFVVPHGNYIGYFKNTITTGEAREQLGISPDKITFLLFGTIHRAKGFLEAIDAFKEIHQQEQIVLLVAGFAAEKALEQEIWDKTQNQENVLFISKRVSDDEIQIYMNASDCVIFPYKVFTTSGAVILAMSFGKACIAPHAGYFADVLNEAGTFFHKPSDHSSLLNSLSKAVDAAENLSNMGRYNLHLTEQHSWEYVAKETLNVYRECLG